MKLFSTDYFLKMRIKDIKQNFASLFIDSILGQKVIFLVMKQFLPNLSDQEIILLLS